VVWSETVGLRTRPVWDQQFGLGPGLAHCGLGVARLVLFCETRSCHARTSHNNFSSTKFIVSLFCNGPTLSPAFTYLKVKSAKCLCLLPMVLVLYKRSSIQSSNSMTQVVSTSIHGCIWTAVRFCTRKSVHLYSVNKSWQNDICSFRAMNVALTLSCKLISF